MKSSIEKSFKKDEESNSINPLFAFFMSVFFVTCKKNIGLSISSNPTWVKNSEEYKELSSKDLIDQFKKNYLSMLCQLTNYYETDENKAKFHVTIADSKKLPIKNSSVDLVITSPPYLTRIDYAAATRTELQMLLGEEKYNILRRESMGTTTVSKTISNGEKKWGSICLDVLKKVEEHKSRASGTYYLKNKIKYFSDAYSSLEEIYRVLKNGAKSYLVLQNSYYKEVEIPLYDIYCEMAKNIGFKSSEVVNSEKVRVSLGHINPRSKVYLNDRVYYEKIIRIIK